MRGLLPAKTPLSTQGAPCLAGQKHRTDSSAHSKEGYCLTLSSPYSSHCSSSFAGIKRGKAAQRHQCCRLELKCLDSTGRLRDWNTKRCKRSCLRQSWNEVLQLWKRSCLNFCKQYHKVIPVWRTFPGRTQWITEHKFQMRNSGGSLFIYLLI